MIFNKYPLDNETKSKIKNNKLKANFGHKIKLDVRRNKDDMNKFMFRIIVNLKNVITDFDHDTVDIESDDLTIFQELNIKIDYFTTFEETEIQSIQINQIFIAMLKNINEKTLVNTQIDKNIKMYFEDIIQKAQQDSKDNKETELPDTPIKVVFDD